MHQNTGLCGNGLNKSIKKRDTKEYKSFEITLFENKICKTFFFRNSLNVNQTIPDFVLLSNDFEYRKFRRTKLKISWEWQVNTDAHVN